MCLLCGVDGPTSVVALSATWGLISFDTIFAILKLEAPASVEASSSDRTRNTPACLHRPFMTFSAWRHATGKIQLYDGGLKRRAPEEMEENIPLKGDGEEEDEGLLFIGDRGKILCAFNGGNPKLIPRSKMPKLQAAAKNTA